MENIREMVNKYLWDKKLKKVIFLTLICKSIFLEGVIRSIL